MPDPSRPDATTPIRLQISGEDQPGTKVMTLAGELDIASAPLFEQAIDELDASDTRRLLIDLTELLFMDSTGLRALLRARQAAAAADRQMLLRPGPRQVQRVFELSGTLDRFTFQD